MNFPIYGTLSAKEKLFADLLIELIAEVKSLKPEFVGEFDETSELGPLDIGTRKGGGYEKDNLTTVHILDR